MIAEIVVSNEIKKVITSDLAWHYRIIPSRLSEDILELFIQEDKIESHDELEIVLGRRIKLIPSDIGAIEKALSMHYVKSAGRPAEPGTLKFEASQKDFVAELIKEAQSLKSSDIHIEIYRDI
jgi:type IV pilus assembly protein PilB